MLHSKSSATLTALLTASLMTGCQTVSAESRSSALAPVESIEPSNKRPAAVKASVDTRTLQTAPLASKTTVAAVTSAPAAPAPTAALTSTAANPAWNLVQQMDELQKLLSTLQGKVEEQQFEIARLKEDARVRYVDLDQRVTQLETKPASAAAVTPAVTPSASPAAASTVADIEAQKKAYLAAYEEFRNKGPDAGVSAMQAFIQSNPDSVFTANAHYWLGEFYLAKSPSDVNAAKKSFNTVINDFPSSPKVASSLYKMGLIADLNNQRNDARQAMQDVIARFADSPEASLAKTFLEQNPPIGANAKP